MDKNLYLSIIRAISAIQDQDSQPLIRHIDLWNRNIEFIEQDTPWQRPAVFIEFLPQQWQHLKPAPNSGQTCLMKSQGTLRLHIVTDWHPQQPLQRIDIVTLVAKAVTPLRGDTFSSIRLTETAYSHDHEDIVEDIATFTFTAWRQW